MRGTALARIGAAALLLAALVNLSACVPAVPEAPLQLAANRYWIGYAPIFLAQDLGYLDPERVNVNEMPSTTDVMSAWRNGSVDVAALTLDEAMILSETSADLRILFVMDTSNGADALMAKPGIATIEDLRGARIGAERTAVGAYVLSRALQAGGLTTSDVTVVSLTMDMQHEAYLRGEIDALVTYEPLVTVLRDDGAVTLMDTSQMPNEVFDVMVARADIVRDRPEDIKSITEAWFRALDTFEADPARALSTMAVRSGVTSQTFMAGMRGITVPDKAESDRLIGQPDPAILEPARRLAEVMLRDDLLRQRVDPAMLLVGASGE